MTMRYFLLQEDRSLEDRWQLGGFQTLGGQQQHGGLQGIPVELEAGVRVFPRKEGLAPDFNLMSGGVPVVSERVAAVFRALAPDDVQLIPAEIEEQTEPWFLLNATRHFACVDEEASEEAQPRYSVTVLAERYEPVVEWDSSFYLFIHGLRLDASKVEGAKVFRLAGALEMLVVSEELRAALEATGGTGMSFQDVSDVRSLDPESRARGVKVREAWQQARASRLAFLQGLGTRVKGPVELLDLHSAWPRARGSARELSRPGGRSLLVTDGLSDPFVGATEPSVGFGMELALETDEPVEGLEGGPESGWQRHLLMLTANRIAEDGELRARLAQGPVLLVLDTSIPKFLLNQHGQGAVLLGMKAETLPERFTLPAGEVRLVTVKALLGTEFDWLSSGDGTAPALAELFARSEHGHLSTGARPPVVEGPPAKEPERPAPPPPSTRYFMLTEDGAFFRREVFDALRGPPGGDFDSDAYRTGQSLPRQDGLRISLAKPGLTRDYALVEFTLPVVTARLVEVLQAVAPGDVEAIPVTVDGREAPSFLLNVTRLVRCIDDEASREVRRYTKEDGGPPPGWQAYAWLRGPRIHSFRVKGAKVFRPWGWPFALIVTGEVKAALEAAGFTGMRFTQVEGPTPDEQTSEAVAERALEAAARANAARDEVWRGLGTLDEDYLPSPGSGLWPGREGQRRIQRPGGRTLFVTHGLSSPFLSDPSPSVGLGVELALEVEGPLEDTAAFDPQGMWPARLLSAVSYALAINPVALGALALDFMMVEVIADGMPASLLTQDGGVFVLLERASAPLPEFFSLPAGEVRLITAKVLLPEELRWTRDGKGTEKELLQRLAEAGVDTVYREGRKPVV
ncbi:imm11 family protein [Corallococcus aberystwythensis]|uniref:Immunity MXAN-0049 protein domain-containing protein n=1 Tax=Corallococcus aberystwythensis TaxID=2316722 RepID=A0A3A8QEQ6_9BACT|nr:DUF1629 domain-containing protein [Corallococcus aberystwythensis]RKH64735.1 hypothetical protein D7W81_18005 [Corallococcus aberystwythensis]